MASSSFSSFRKRFRQLGNSKKRKILSSFFKCGPGQYGEGDEFIGIPIPELRKLIIHGKDFTFGHLDELLDSHLHEERMLALLILVERFKKSEALQQKLIFDFYLKRLDAVNNWDLVDLSAHQIVGVHLEKRSKSLLFKLVRSQVMWHRRVAVVSTLQFIRQKKFDEIFELSRLLLNDPEDLMHKACGWMLREAGKRDVDALKSFLKKHAHQMPRTMLRYAIEKFPEKKRQAYLKIRKAS